MDRQDDTRPDATQASPEHDAGATPTTRRSFLSNVGRKAAYITPILLTLSAAPAAASSAIPSYCTGAGSPCSVDGDCCSESCGVGTPEICD